MDAVRCAVGIQQALRIKNDDLLQRPFAEIVNDPEGAEIFRRFGWEIVDLRHSEVKGLTTCATASLPIWVWNDAERPRLGSEKWRSGVRRNVSLFGENRDGLQYR